MTDDAYLNEQEVAGLLKISTKTLKRMRVAGGGPRFSKLGVKLVRYRAGDVRAWAESCSRRSTSETSQLEAA